MDVKMAVHQETVRMKGGLFGKETAGGYFAVEAESETVVYNYFFDLETAALDVEDFVSTLEKILQLCDIWAERIQNALSVDEKLLAEQPASPFGNFSIYRHFHIHP